VGEVLGADLLPAQLASLRGDSREFTVASIFCAILATLALWPAVPHDSLAIWALVSVAWSLLRETIMHFQSARLSRKPLQMLLVTSAVVAGATWGALALLYFDPQSTPQAVFVALVVVAMTAVSLVWLSAWSMVYFAFAIPAVASLIWVLFATSNFIAGVLVATFLVSVLYLAYKLEHDLLYRTALQGQNTDLSAQIQSGDTRIRQARRAVERASAAKVEFLAAAGQDVRQPLFAMNLLLDTLRSSDDEAERQHAIDRVDESLHGLDATFESLLDMSRLESSLVQSDVQSFHLRDVTAQLCSEGEIIAANQGLRFISRVRDAVLRSDPRMVQRIVRHLVNNALQHTEQGGVLLATRMRPTEVWIEVWDTGPGISDTELRNVFQEFYKVDRPDGNRSDGLGLGLTVTQRLCDLLHHPLELRTRVGRGSMFRVRVPRGSPRALRDSVLALPVSDDATLDDTTILILDSRRDMLDALEPVLRRWGCSVWPALSGEEAVSLVQMDAVTPDAVICECQLRGEESGFEVVKRLRAHLGDDLAVIMTSGESNGSDIWQRAARERVELLYKPLKPEQLHATLLRLLGYTEPEEIVLTSGQSGESPSLL
jgi:signal transduction histidine kinase/ActR/RegA family two-component response regulator